jgi:hypothetical protein
VLAEGKACNYGCHVESATGGGDGHSSSKKDGSCKRRVELYTGENNRDMHPGEL